MGDIVDMLTHRKRKAQAPETQSEGVFYCTHCYWDFFSLNTKGEVKCASCGALIDNLMVAEGALRRP